MSIINAQLIIPEAVQLYALEPSVVQLTLVPPAPVNLQIGGGGGGSSTVIIGTPNEVDVVSTNGVTEIGLPDDVYATHFHGNLLGKVTAEVKNNSGVTIAKGMPVYVTGTVGNTHVLEVAICKSNTIDPNTQKSEICIGLMEDTLLQGEFGHVVLCGLLEDVDTSTPALWQVGDTLYLNSVQTNANHTLNWITNDALQITDDQSLQTVGSITRHNQNNGSIFVNPKLHERVSKMRLSNLVDVESNTDSIYSGRQLLSKALGANGTWGAISELTYALHNQFTYINGASATDPQTGISLTYGMLLPGYNAGTRAAWDGDVPKWDDENEQWVATPLSIDSISDFKERKVYIESECNSAGEFTLVTLNSPSNVFNTTNLDVVGRFGILNSGTGTSTNAVGGIGSANESDSISFGSHKVSTTAIVRIPTLSTAADRFIIEHGFSDNRQGVPIDGALIQYSHDINGGKWIGLVYANNVLVASLDLGVTVAANTWYKLKTVVNVNRSVEFYIDDLNVGLTGISTAPDGTSSITRRCGFHCTIRKTAGANTRNLYTDYINLQIDGTR